MRYMLPFGDGCRARRRGETSLGGAQAPLRAAFEATPAAPPPGRSGALFFARTRVVVAGVGAVVLSIPLVLDAFLPDSESQEHV